MANYTNIKGFFVQYLDADPSNPIEGEIWYRTDQGGLKFWNGSAAEDITTD